MARQKKTRQQQAAETRRKLLASARKLFANYGFSGTRVRAINREAGMADGLLYHYFPGGKREMLEVLIKESLEAQKAYFDSLIGEIEEMPLEKVLDEIFLLGEKIFSRLFEENLDLMKILIREIDTIDLGQMEFLTKTLRDHQKWAADFLKRRHEKGEIRKMDFDMAAEQLFAVGVNNLISRITKIEIGQMNTPEKRKRLVRHTLDMWKTP